MPFAHLSRLTHGPPHTILDRNTHFAHHGCPTLLAHISGRIRPRLHVFGHIHEDHGVVVRSWEDGGEGEETIFVNAAAAPGGSRAKGDDGTMVDFGGKGFQPILVDMRD